VSQEAACDVVLTREQLHYLGRYVAGAPAACSPFHGVRPPEELPAPALDDLVARRLLGPRGVEPRLLWALERLHGAEAFGGIALRGEALETEGVSFFAGADSVALVNVAPGLRVVSPAPAGELAALLEQLLGSGSRRDASLDVALGVSESRVLAAALDLLRRESLRDLVGGKAEPVREEALTAWILRDDPSAQWLGRHLAPLLARRGGGGFEPRSVPSLVAQLVERGLLVAGEGGLGPGAALAPLVRRMALLDRVFDLRAGRAAGGASPVAADIVVVKADSGTLLLWEAGPDGSLRWVTPSADEAKVTAMRLLTRADALARVH
jgi:hypothetical protein